MEKKDSVNREHQKNSIFRNNIDNNNDYDGYDQLTESMFFAILFCSSSGGTPMATTPTTHPWVVIAKMRVEHGGHFSGLRQGIVPGTASVEETTVIATFDEFAQAEAYVIEQLGPMETVPHRRNLSSGGLVFRPRNPSRYTFFVLYSLSTFLEVFKNEFREIRLD